MSGLFRASLFAVILAIGASAASAQLVPVPSALPGAGPAVVTAWPITVDSSVGPIQVFQPQPESLIGDSLKARAAVSVVMPGATDPTFGAVWLTARIVTDRDAGVVAIRQMSVDQVKFAGLPDQQNQQYSQAVQQQLPGVNVTLSRDQMLAALDESAKEDLAAKNLQSTPPNIIFIPNAATLVLIDGDPKMQAVDNEQGLLRVVNTPFIILFDTASRTYFLKAGVYWYAATDVTAPWQNVGSIPANVLRVGTALTTVAQQDPNAPAPQQQPNPGQIIVSTQPAELISTNGPATYTPLPGNELLYVGNTQADVFLELATQQTYVLLSGRWFRSRSLQNGPWEYVASDQLPPSFGRIPMNSAKGHVLASVAGTVQAHDAYVDAQIPQTASVARAAGSSLVVQYDGDPQWAPVAVDMPAVRYCVNSPVPVLWVGGRYYCCHQAVWYESDIWSGRWVVCLNVPGEIYSIPPACPVYYCRYCYVYGYNNDVVYCGYLPGYTGCYVYGPTVVYGTGYYYHGWYGRQYYPYPCTWGFAVRYDVTIGVWGEGAHARYDRAWLANSDRHGWWGPRGYLDYHEVHNTTIVKNTVINNTTIINRNTVINRFNIYNRGENVTRKIVVDHGIETAHRATGAVNERPVVVHHETPAVKNNVYVGKDGGVYRQTDKGWEQHNGKTWNEAPKAPDVKQDRRTIDSRYNAPPETPKPRYEEPKRGGPTETPRREPTPSRYEEPKRSTPSEPSNRFEKSDRGGPSNERGGAKEPRENEKGDRRNERNN